MTEIGPSPQNPRVVPQGDMHIFTTNYDAVVGQGVENMLNLTHGAGIIHFSGHGEMDNGVDGVLLVAEGDTEVGTYQNLILSRTIKAKKAAWELSKIAGVPHHGAVLSKSEEPDVPFGAEQILTWISTPDRMAFVLDTFEQGFRNRVKRRGEAAARRWYMWQVIRTFGDSLLQLAPRVVGLAYLLRKLGLF